MRLTTMSKTWPGWESNAAAAADTVAVVSAIAEVATFSMKWWK